MVISIEWDYRLFKALHFALQSDVNTVCFADESGHLIYSGSDDTYCKVTLTLIYGICIWDQFSFPRKSTGTVTISTVNYKIWPSMPHFGILWQIVPAF